MKPLFRILAPAMLSVALAACSPPQNRAAQAPSEATPEIQPATFAATRPARNAATRRKPAAVNKTQRLRELEKAYVVLDDADARSATIDSIAELEIPGIAEVLGRLFALETDPELKEALLSEIGWSDEPEPVKATAMTLALQLDQPASVRRAAIEELLDFEAETALPLLRPMLNDPDEDVRSGAKDAIYVFENP